MNQGSFPISWLPFGNAGAPAMELSPSLFSDVSRLVLSHEMVEAPFLLVRVDGVGPEAVARGLAKCRNAGAVNRIVLAGCSTSLTLIDQSLTGDEQFSLMLDDVAADTPLTALTWDRLGAIRFTADFVAAGLEDLRVRLVLEAMLGLSTNLGLCKLGPDGYRSATLSGADAFDFVSGIVPWGETLLDGDGKANLPAAYTASLSAR